MTNTNKRYDHKKILTLSDEGMSMKEIAEEVGCSLGCVKNVLETGGRLEVLHRGDYESLKVPITKEEIERFRGMLKIGSEIYLTKKDSVDERTMRRVKYTVVAKYRHFFIARSQRGEEKSILYTEQIIRDGRPTV